LSGIAEKAVLNSTYSPKHFCNFLENVIVIALIQLQKIPIYCNLNGFKHFREITRTFQLREDLKLGN